MKKHWYDYLWILSLTYLMLRFFNILFAWLGLLCFFIPLIISLTTGSKGYCNRYCGRGPVIGAVRRPVWTFPKKRDSKMDEAVLVPLRISGFLFYHVFSDAVEYLSGIFRSPGFKTGSHSALDI